MVKKNEGNLKKAMNELLGIDGAENTVKYGQV